MKSRFSYPVEGLDFDFQKPQPEGHANSVSRLSVGFYEPKDGDTSSPVVWELTYDCGESSHNYTIRYHLRDVDSVVKTLIEWSLDDDLPLTSEDVGGIMSALIGLSDGADSGEATN